VPYQGVTRGRGRARAHPHRWQLLLSTSAFVACGSATDDARRQQVGLAGIETLTAINYSGTSAAV